MASIDELFGLHQALLEAAPLEDRISNCLSTAMRFLDTTDAGDLVESFAPFLDLNHAQAQWLVGALSSLHHVGLMLAPGIDGTKLLALCAGAGFDGTHHTFPSAIVAKELGDLVGRERVETTIHTIGGRTARGVDVAVELFVPEAPPHVVDRWIVEGRCLHVAFKTKTRDAITAIHGLFESRGIRLPAFMGGKAMENRAERSLSLYFDVDVGRPLRIQFYHV